MAEGLGKLCTVEAHEATVAAHPQDSSAANGVLNKLSLTTGIDYIIAPPKDILRGNYMYVNTVIIY